MSAANNSEQGIGKIILKIFILHLQNEDFFLLLSGKTFFVK